MYSVTPQLSEPGFTGLADYQDYMSLNFSFVPNNFHSSERAEFNSPGCRLGSFMKRITFLALYGHDIILDA
jgi:hypothetical protein